MITEAQKIMSNKNHKTGKYEKNATTAGINGEIGTVHNITKPILPGNERQCSTTYKASTLICDLHNLLSKVTSSVS